MWELTFIDFYGTKTCIPFYITERNVPLLLDNNVMSRSDLLAIQNILVIPADFIHLLSLKLHFAYIREWWQKLFLDPFTNVPTITKHLSSFCASFSILTEDEMPYQESPYSNREYVRNFAIRL